MAIHRGKDMILTLRAKLDRRARTLQPYPDMQRYKSPMKTQQEELSEIPGFMFRMLHDGEFTPPIVRGKSLEYLKGDESILTTKRHKRCELLRSCGTL